MFILIQRRRQSLGCLVEQERSTAWSLHVIPGSAYLVVVVAFEVPQLALKVCRLDWSITMQRNPMLSRSGSGLRRKVGKLHPSLVDLWEVENKLKPMN